MILELEKSQIIEEIKLVNDKRLLKTLKRLLGIDYDDELSDDHKKILDGRIDAYESGQVVTIGWDEAKKRLFDKK